MCINPQVLGTCDRSAHADRRLPCPGSPQDGDFRENCSIANKRDGIMSTVAVVGLGYVGFPLAVAFGKKLRTIGFDPPPDKIENYPPPSAPPAQRSAQH